MKIAVVADIHRMAPGGVTCGKRMGGRAVPLLKAALAAIAARGDVAAICVAGDCVDKPGDLDGLRELQAVLEGCARQPFVAIPGNHDPAPEVFHAIVPKRKWLDVEGVRIVPFWDEERPGWNAERTEASFLSGDALCRGFAGMKVFLQHVPLFPSGAPGVKYAYLNADAAVASMKRNGAVLAISGHQHEGVPLLRRDRLSFVCAPALCEPPFRFLVLEIAADGRIGAEEVSLQSAVSGA